VKEKVGVKRQFHQGALTLGCIAMVVKQMGEGYQ
jgi:hypothetical protein